MQLSYYPGCTSHSTAAEYGMSTEAVLRALGVELLEIEDWNCCGAAAAHTLSRLLSLALPARNIAKTQERELPLVVPCAGCFNNLKKAEAVLKTGGELARQIEELVGFRYEESTDILALIDVVVNRIGLDRVRQKVVRPLTGLRVAAYYGCALVRNPKITHLDDPENPMYIDRIVEVLGATPVEWSYKTECCGADLALTHGERVAEMVTRIIEMAREAGADCLACSCGLCQANLEMRQKSEAEGLPVYYFTELMGLAMGLEGQKRWWSKHVVDSTRLLRKLKLI
ncbi:MAG: CoB--CoM heterodisulfide reductase iron-sulfur subunit B family protein [Deltaproteobacteria bacterium]|nr:CoB--CoM heterodisulfide reductase iron-sulfur subunit B family protein [Deltaproteobacteria bacterium]MBW2120506.1 CoB--CoM heterodisulfide reductase iron-sulfur subunit B family protein [Deltaproteobacteria bacterium]